MPQKSMWRIYFARDGICLFLNCPRIGHIYFWFCSRFQIDHVLSSRKALLYVRKSWNAPFSHLILKKGTLSLWKQERNWKWIWSISGHFKNKFKCYHIQNISSTYFCRISSDPPLLLNCRVLIWPDFV